MFAFLLISFIVVSVSVLHEQSFSYSVPRPPRSADTSSQTFRKNNLKTDCWRRFAAGLSDIAEDVARPLISVQSFSKQVNGSCVEKTVANVYHMISYYYDHGEFNEGTCVENAA